MIAPVWQRLRALRFRLWQRQRYDALCLEQVAGLALVILPGVFNPAIFETGPLLADALLQEPNIASRHVLDMGTGSGIVGLRAAQNGATVTAADINPQAVRCARINALLNQLETRITAVESDLFSALEGKQFDIVAFNPPFYRGTPTSRLDHAWRGVDVAERFARSLPHHLTPDGCALVILASTGDEAGFVAAFRSAGLRVTPIRRYDRINEILTLYRLTRT